MHSGICTYLRRAWVSVSNGDTPHGTTVDTCYTAASSGTNYKETERGGERERLWLVVPGYVILKRFLNMGTQDIAYPDPLVCFLKYVLLTLLDLHSSSSTAGY